MATGGHIDTQPTAGKFDGNYGVLAGQEVLRTLADHSIRTRGPLELCEWTIEEGAHFAPVMMGSGGVCQRLARGARRARPGAGGRR